MEAKLSTPRIGWLADLEQLAQNPSRMDQVQERLGINTIWLESGRFHTAGYRLSKQAWESSPFKDWRSRPGLARHRQARRLPETSFPVLPGILAGADDSDLQVVMAHAHRLGIELWGHMGLWSYGGMIYPELAVKTLAGVAIPAEEDRWGACFCPSKKDLNRWLAACLEDSIRSYPLQGIEVDHARYVPPQSLPNLLACACPDCARRAAEWGEDLTGLAQSILESFRQLKSAPAGQIRKALGEAHTIPELLDSLTAGQAASRWLALRARFLSVEICQMAEAAHRAGGKSFLFGIDVLPPSVGLLGGHDYAGLSCLDYFTGGFGLIGWERISLSTCLEWARLACRTWPGLEEGFILAQLCRLFGLPASLLPSSTAGLEQPSKDVLAEVEVGEIRRMAALRPAEMPVYPPVSLPSLGLAGLDKICRAVNENGLDGVFLAGLENLSLEGDQKISAALTALGSRLR